MRNLFVKFLGLFMLLFFILGCNNSAENKNNGVDNNTHINNSSKSNNKASSNSLSESNEHKGGFVPSITDVSRFAYVYPSSDKDNDANHHINVYNDIGDDGKPKLRLKKNTNVWINLTVDKSWFQLITENDKWGYVKKDVVKMYPRAIVNTKSGRLNMRDRKGLDSTVIKGISKDSLVYVLNIDDEDWYLIRDDKGDIGYVSGKYLKFVDSKRNLSVGIAQQKFLENFFQIKETEYLFMLEEYKDIALNKHIITGDFNGGGRLDKCFFAVRSGGDNDDDNIYMVVWHSETNTYLIIKAFEANSYVGLELFPGEEKLQSTFEEESIMMNGDGIGLVYFDSGKSMVYYWDDREYRAFIYNE